MKLLHKPYWLFLCVTLPQGIVFLLFYKIYGTIGSQLKPENTRAWVLFGAALGILCLGATCYGAYALIKKKALNSLAGFPLLAAYIAFLYLFLWQSGTVIPWNIPDWMLFGIQPEIYMLTFLMPVLSYGLILLVSRYMPKKEGYSAWKDLAGTIAIPIGWYVTFMLLIPLIRQLIKTDVRTGFLTHAGAILFVTSSVLFLFFLIRLVCMLLINKPKIWHILRIPIITVLPILGLLTNNNGFRGLTSGFGFGDFSHPAFYILALLTAGLLLLPPMKNKIARLSVFFGKSLTFTYTCYFFIVFLPYLPLSIAAVIAVGLGFLMLTPLILMFVHVRSLWEDVSVLRQSFKKYQLVLVFILGIAILPASVAVSFNKDRISLNSALNYVYEPDYSTSSAAAVNPEALKRTLKNTKSNKEGNGRLGRILPSGGTPYLTSFYRWMVLDNLTLTDRKISELESIFFGSTDVKPGNSTAPGENISGEENASGAAVNIKTIKTKTVVSDDGKTSKSWINFEMVNSQSSQQEYVTSFVLPAGSWIGNYYLDVEGVRKYGILADKRAAVWVYNQITSWRRDPGILYYLKNGSVAFRVFPFQPNEVRKTGIEVIHQGDVSLFIDGNEIVLHGRNNPAGSSSAIMSSDGKSAFVSAEAKGLLPKVTRKPHYYFLLDFSGREAGGTADLIEKTAAFIKQQGIQAEEATVSAVNDEVRQIAATPGWEDEIGKYSAHGGFFLDRAVRKALLSNERSGRQERAVIVAVSHTVDKTLMLDDFDGFKKAFPEDAAYLELQKDGMLYECPIMNGNSSASAAAIGAIPQKAVLAWPDDRNPRAYLSDNGQGSLVLLDPEQNFDPPAIESATWDNGLILAAMNLSLDLNPAEHYRKSMSILKSSFKSGIMTPQTSYIVVENEAQEKALLEKQRQLLASQKNLDAGNDEARMSEPSIIYILLAAAVVYLLKMRRQRRKPKASPSV